MKGFSHFSFCQEAVIFRFRGEPGHQTDLSHLTPLEALKRLSEWKQYLENDVKKRRHNR